jgi:hypothetical protein
MVSSVIIADIKKMEKEDSFTSNKWLRGFQSDREKEKDFRAVGSNEGFVN